MTSGSFVWAAGQIINSPDCLFFIKRTDFSCNKSLSDALDALVCRLREHGKHRIKGH